MLSDRRQRVLRALIEEYVANAMPVGSRTLTERYQLGVSPATVRNELSALEEAGLISQPHTSAGRIPTDHGYRAFVDSLVEQGLVSEEGDYRSVTEELRSHASELDSLLERTTQVLTRMTDCLSVVMAPTVRDLSIKQITLVTMDSYRVLLVLITEEGNVLNRQMEFSEPVNVEDIAAVQRFLNEVLSGKSLTELESGLEISIRESYHNIYVRAVLHEIVDCLKASVHDSGAPHSYRLGLSSLMTQPEFASSRSLVPIMQVLEDDTVLLQLVEHAQEEGQTGPKVTIGTENPDFGLPGVSVVASKYGRGSSAGVVAVIGPTRMDYSKVINAVRAVSSALHEE